MVGIIKEVILIIERIIGGGKMGKMSELNGQRQTIDEIENKDKIDKIIDWDLSDTIDKIVSDVKSIIANKDEQINFLLTHNKWLKERNVSLEKKFKEKKNDE